MTDCAGVSVPWIEESAESATFLAVVPPAALVDEIQSVQTSVGIDTSVAPHITVKAQPGLQAPDHWRPTITDAVAEFPVFPVALGPVGWFGDDILFLEVRSNELAELHLRVLEALEQIGVTERFEYDGEAFIPHLTLAAVFAGATRKQLVQLAEAVGRRPWPTFNVDAVVEFHRASRAALYRPTRRLVLASS
jgi:2'-5' RNA ligase